MMKKLLWPTIITIGLAAVVLSLAYQPATPAEKIYVAVEGDGLIAVIDPARQKVIKKISLATEHDGGLLPYAPHNVQVSLDGRSVWVTANAGSHQNHTSFLSSRRALAHGDEPKSGENDEVIVINPLTDEIIARRSLGSDLHLAHVVLTPDSNYAYVTAQEADKIYKIDVQTALIPDNIREVASLKIPGPKTIALPPGSEPHGLRIAPDGKTAYVALLGGKSLGILDLKTDTMTFVPLGGQAVQTGVTPDGKMVVVSLYDTKQLVVYPKNLLSRIETAEPEVKLIRYINLPPEAHGSIQMYPTADSRFVYLADQGYYFNQPTGRSVFKIDLATNQVVNTIETGNGPHGVTLSSNNRFVYVTNLLDGDVVAIDVATDEIMWKVAVGKEPNGVSSWPGTPPGK